MLLKKGDRIDNTIENIIKDSFNILCCPEIKCSKKETDNDDGVEEESSVSVSLDLAKNKVIKKTLQ